MRGLWWNDTVQVLDTMSPCMAVGHQVQLHLMHFGRRATKEAPRWRAYSGDGAQAAAAAASSRSG
jgi:hypothetical protein